MTTPQQPQTTVVEFGGAAPGPGPRRWQDPRLAWVPAGLGAAALFGSLVGEWQVVTGQVDSISDAPDAVGVWAVNAFGAGWVLGGILLACCAGLALVGQAVVRPVARTAGLVLAIVLAGVLLAATLQLDEPVAYRNLGLSMPIDTEWRVTLGRGLYLAYAALGLSALTLWLTRWASASPHAAPPPDPTAPAAPEPGQLSVGPAEPLLHPTKDHEWR